MGRKTAIDPAAATSEICAAMAHVAALSRAQMTKYRAVLPGIADDLRARGFEVAAVVRVPLDRQLAAALATSPAGLSAAQLGKTVVGGSAAEAKRALTTMLRNGDALEVEQLDQRVIVAASQRTNAWLDAAAQVEYGKALTRELRRIKLASKSKLGTSAPKPFFVMGLQPLASATGYQPAPQLGTAPTPSLNADATAAEVALAVRALAAHVQGHLGPIHVPPLLRSLGVPQAIAQSALLAGARAGLFDLEPESGMARLASDDAAWCPIGPGQTRLSWLMPKAPR